MDAVNLLKMTLARSICDDMDCEECKECFNTEECPTSDFDYDTRVDFVKSLVHKLNIGPVDLGELEEMNVDDLLKIVNEVGSYREEQLGNVDEPTMLEDYPVQPIPTIDYTAIAEEIEMPF